MNKWAIIAAIPTPKSKKIAFKEGVMGSNNSIFVSFAQIIIGNKMITKINELDQVNIKKLNSYEEELKSIENEIKLKKNIISEQELEKEVNDIKKKIADFKKEKK